jgi:NAD(P)H-dependent flavin oxidoreductase YrpB (nitropropane dioxygenase family)
MHIITDAGAQLPIIAAPLAGGPTTPEFVLAAASARALGFLAAGYKTAAQFADELETVRTSTSLFGVNLFAPNPIPVDAHAYDEYRAALQNDADRYGVELPATPREDDDAWQDKIDLLVANPVPIVSFTFGIPPDAALAALRRAGSTLVQTVTSADEARRAADAGVDALAVQASAAGGHSGTLTPDHIPPARPLRDLLHEIDVGLPMIAAGGISDPAQVAATLNAGALAVMVGTVLLLAPEAGTSDAYRAALTGADRGDTIVTRAFTGRPARALRNRFTDAHDAHAPSGYPALHYLTSPIRKAAAADKNPEDVNLWAGTGHRNARAQPVATTLRELARDL